MTPLPSNWHGRRRLRASLWLLLIPLAAVIVPAVEQGPAVASTSSQAADRQGVSTAGPVPLARSDTLVTGAATPDGFELLVPAGDSWRVLANLRIGGLDSSLWGGVTCVTGDGRTIGAVFAPVEFANDPVLRAQGAFAATIDVATGTVHLLPWRVELGYHTPGCGVSGQVAFTSQLDPYGQGPTLVHVVGGAGKSLFDVTVDHQVTSPAPTKDGLVASTGNGLERISRSGKIETLGAFPGTVFDVHGSADAGADFLVAHQENGTVDAFHQPASGPARQVGRGVLGAAGLYAGRGGHNQLVGSASATPSQRDVAVRPSPTKPADVSLDGSVAVQSVESPSAATGPRGAAPTPPPTITSRSLTTGATQTASPDNASARAVPQTAGVIVGGSSPCAIDRLDYHVQVSQPMPSQATWAAQSAVLGQLTTPRPANWHNNGLSTGYSPQTLFPMVPLANGTAHMPTQILYGIMAQESNYNQATSHALPGQAGGALVANYYGAVWSSNGQVIVGVDPAKADCGYGIAQITTGMRADDSSLNSIQKMAIATDYQANIASSASVLSRIWNQLAGAGPEGVVANGGDPAKIENWYFTLWAYNSGIQPTAAYGNTTGCSPSPTCTDANGNWGLGWTNNPMNAAYPPDRQPFLKAGNTDATTPWKWPYQEKVFGWIYYGQWGSDGLKFPRVADQPQSLPLTLPSYSLFCSPANHCDPNYHNGSTSYCIPSDRRCWWHDTVSFAQGFVGTTDTTPPPGSTEPGNTNPHPPSCSAASSPVVGEGPTRGLPAGAQVVDDVPDMAWNVVGCGAMPSAGNFVLNTNPNNNSNAWGAVDTHQIGGGYGGHFYFAHTTYSPSTNGAVVGTWTPPSSATGWQDIYVHLPDSGADTTQADYQVKLSASDNTGHHRVVNQRWNQNSWIDLGSFNLGSGASVSLSNATYKDSTGTNLVDVAWDAVAFVPSSKPAVSYVALGDSYGVGEGIEPYMANSDVGKDGGNVDACHRSTQGWPVSVYNSLRAARPGNDEFHFIGCSGAKLDGVLVPTTGLPDTHGEQPQLTQGWLDENTTEVSVSISGNDARFADVLKGCIMTLTNCTDPNYKLTVNGQVDPQPLVQYEPTVIDQQLPRLKTMLQAIRAAAPNAKIVLTLYPHVVAPTNTSSACALNANNPPWFATMADQLDQRILDAVATSGVSRVATADERPPFTDHEACTTSGPEWINAIIAYSSSGSGTVTPGAGSFHPKLAGEPSYSAGATAAFASLP